MPSALDSEIRRAEGDDAIDIVRDTRGQVLEVWVRWHEVADLLSSSPSARHYVVNRLSGEIEFGDGVHGLIPPAGANNVRLRSYQTGGGSVGNQPAGTITQLRSAIPSVASAVNLEAARGGQDAETSEALSERGASWLRHRGRAVAVEDYEDLAKIASSEVARAKCYSAVDLLGEDTSPAAGTVSLVIVPRSANPCPRPTAELLRRVREFLDNLKPVDVDLLVLGPEYVRISVEAQLVEDRSSRAADPISDCETALKRYLHPITGRRDSGGWTFGDLPMEAELVSLLRAVPGVRYIRSLRIDLQEDRPGLILNGRFLTCAGSFRIQLTQSVGDYSIQ